MLTATVFQSTAGPETGRSRRLWPPRAKSRRFQSTAGPETGRSAQVEGRTRCLLRVSIHGRPGDRPLHATAATVRLENVFQSTAGPETGRSSCSHKLLPASNLAKGVRERNGVSGIR